jgi:hypothetical protein
MYKTDYGTAKHLTNLGSGSCVQTKDFALEHSLHVLGADYELH